MQSKAATVDQYLAELPADRREVIGAVRGVILKNLGAGFEEGMQYGMIGYFVPRSVYPAGYHCDPRQPLPFAGLGSQKNHMALYLFCVYQSEGLREWFVEAWEVEAARGRAGKLDMGAGCVRFRKLEDVPLAVVGRAIKRVSVKKFIAQYEAVLGEGGRRGAAAEEKPTRTTKQPDKRVGKKAAKTTAKDAAGRTSKKSSKRASGR